MAVHSCTLPRTLAAVCLIPEQLPYMKGSLLENFSVT